MTDRVIIEGRELDLYPDTRIALTLQVNDLSEIADRQTSRSNSFNVPRTRENDLTFGLAALPTSESTAPYTKLKATHLRNGVDILGPCTAYVDETDDGYKVVLVSSEVDLFKLLDERLLSDLDFSDLNHEFNLTNIIASRTNTDGLIYALAAYTLDPAYIDNATTKYDIRRTQFCLFAKTVVRRIIEGAGFTLDAGSFFDTDPVASKLLFHASPDKWGNSGKILNAVKTTPQTIVVTNTRIIIDDDSSGDQVLRTGAYDLGNNWREAVPAGPLTRYYPPQQFTAPKEGAVRFRVNYSFTVAASATFSERVQFSIVAASGGTERLVYSGAFVEVPPGQTISGLQTIVLPAGTYTSGAGDYIELVPRILSNNPLGATASVLTIQPGTGVEAWLYTGAPFAIGDPVPVSEQLSAMKQKDFIKGLSQLFALNWDVDTFSGEFGVVSFNDIAASRTRSQDWSDKIVTVVPTSQFRIGKYARKNYLRWTEDVVKDGYGDGSFEVFDQTLDAETDLFTLPFAASPNETLLVDKVLPLIERWSTGATAPDKEVKPRLLLLDDMADVYPGSSIDYYDGTTTTTVTTDLPYCHFIFPGAAHNLGFDDSLIRDYYGPVVEMLRYARKIVAEVKLSEVDIASMDWTAPVYVSQWGGYYYVNKLSNVLPGRLTKVELLKL